MIFFKNFFEKRIQVAEPEDLAKQEAKKPAEIKKEPTRRESLSPLPRTMEEEILETRERISSKPLAGRGDRLHFISLKDDGDCVFKPVSGEYKRERAAYLVDRFLGFDFVPPTVIREIDGRIGSVQQFVADTTFIYSVPQSERDRWKAYLMKLWIFDYIIWNADRNEGNFLLKVKERKIFAIDHGYSFASTGFYPHREYFGDLMPQEIIEKINKFLSWEDGIKILSDLLGELLSEEEVRACICRIKKLAKLFEKRRIDSSDKLDFDPQIN